MLIHRENPLKFDFIVDNGDAKLKGIDLTVEYQRMVNYFLAALAVPEQDLWVNLSPVEKDRIIPDQLIRTELGRDLLAQDYILKQLTASMIYPEEGLGKSFWATVYEEAHKRLGVTEIPVDVFNKVWIVPDKAAVFEKNDIVYIAQAHLKVMLEADYLAQDAVTGVSNGSAENQSQAGEISKKILREIVVPAIEKEVNEGRNFAQIRQIFYALILAQWYRDVLKESVLNKVYAGRNKVVGIDLSDSSNKERIYSQYMAAYKKGVFNYIKEETDRLTNEPIPKKYFSGGFQSQRVLREAADQAMVTQQAGRNFELLSVKISQVDAAQSHQEWNELGKPLDLLNEVKVLWEGGQLDEQGLIAFLKKYSAQVNAEAEKGYPVQGVWPVTKAITLLSKEQEQQIVELIQKTYQGKRPLLEDAILLMNNVVDSNWLKQQAPRLVGKTILVASSEIHLWVGGLGPVINFDLKGLRGLGADARGMEPDYQLRQDTGNLDGSPTDYQALGMGGINTFDQYTIVLGDKNGKGSHEVKVRVRTGVDENGIPSYLVRDIQTGLVSTLKFADKGLSINPQDLLKALLARGVIEDIYGTEGKEGYITKDVQSMAGQIGAIVAQLFNQLSPEEAKKIANKASKIKEDTARIIDILGQARTEESSFYMRMPYNYGGRNNPVTKRESMAFLNVAMSEFINRHPPDVVLANDGQFGPLQATALSRHKDNPKVSQVLWGFRTHTYDAMGQGNRGESWDVDWEINVFLKHMLKVADGYINFARRTGHIDDTSLGVRMAHFATGVSNKQIDDMGPLDAQYANLTAVTNPAVPEIMAKIFREEFDKLKSVGTFPAEADYERPQANELAITKVATKERVNSMKIQSSIGRTVNVDINSPLIGEARRFVVVKAGRQRAFHDDNIWSAVQMGATVVIIGNNQGKQSEGLVNGLSDLERRIFEEKTKRPAEFPGDFFFIDTAVGKNVGFGDLKKAFLSAADLQIQDSDEHTGAAEFSEEDVTSNGGYQAGPRYGGQGEGVITAQGIEVIVTRGADGRLIWKRVGNTWIPKEDTPQSWLDTVYRPFIELWKQDSQRIDFYTGAALSPRVNRIQRYLIPNAVMLRTIDQVMERNERELREDTVFARRVVQGLTAKDADDILIKGRNGVRAFGFKVEGQGYFPAADRPEENSGMESFLKKRTELEAQFGYDALVDQFVRGDFQNFVLALIHGLPAEAMVRNWLDTNVDGPIQKKMQRFQRFVDNMGQNLSIIRNGGQVAVEPASAQAEAPTSENKKDAAQIEAPGGIDVRKVSLERQGELISNVVSDQALEEVIANAAGIRGIIIGINPLENLGVVLGLHH